MADFSFLAIYSFLSLLLLFLCGSKILVTWDQKVCFVQRVIKLRQWQRGVESDSRERERERERGSGQ